MLGRTTWTDDGGETPEEEGEDYPSWVHEPGSASSSGGRGGSARASLNAGEVDEEAGEQDRRDTAAADDSMPAWLREGGHTERTPLSAVASGGDRSGTGGSAGVRYTQLSGADEHAVDESRGTDDETEDDAETGRGGHGGGNGYQSGGAAGDESRGGGDDDGTPAWARVGGTGTSTGGKRGSKKGKKKSKGKKRLSTGGGSRKGRGSQGSDDEYDDALGDAVGDTVVRRGCALSTFLAINIVVVLAALAEGVGQVLYMVSFQMSVHAYALRCYALLFCILVIFCEFEITQTVRQFVLVRNWFCRGLLYIFIGLLALEEQDEKTHPSGSVFLYIQISGLIMVAFGVLYAVMGLLCIRMIRDHKLSRYRTLLRDAERDKARRKQRIVSA